MLCVSWWVYGVVWCVADQVWWVVLCQKVQGHFSAPVCPWFEPQLCNCVQTKSYQKNMNSHLWIILKCIASLVYIWILSKAKSIFLQLLVRGHFMHAVLKKQVPWNRFGHILWDLFKHKITNCMTRCSQHIFKYLFFILIHFKWNYQLMFLFCNAST